VVTRVVLESLLEEDERPWVVVPVYVEVCVDVSPDESVVVYVLAYLIQRSLMYMSSPHCRWVTAMTGMMSDWSLEVDIDTTVEPELRA